MYQTFSKSLITCVTFFSFLNAGEVDTYYAWQHEIKDSSVVFNQYINDEVNVTLAKVNKKWGTPSCEEAALDIMEDIGSNNYLIKKIGALNAPLEKWAQDNPEIDKYPRQGDSLDEYVSKSIYAPEFKIFYLPAELDVTVNVNGVYFGTDKLSHFVGSGFEYYRKYLKFLDEYSPTMAEALAVKWGVTMESGIIGLRAVGVFSYADLEANFQGLKMAQDFCTAYNPKLQLIGKNWVLSQKIDFRDYVNPNWDETFNISTYTEKRLVSIKENVKQFDIYDRSQTQWVRNFINRYKTHYVDDYENKKFLDTGLSSKLLYMAQVFAIDALDAEQYYTYANSIDLTLTYEEYLEFRNDMELMQQEDYTLEVLSDH